jgi:membrane protein
VESFIRRLGRFLSWHRRAVAALLAGLGAFAMVTYLSPNDRDRVPAVVLARSVAAGTVLKNDDLKVARLPSDALPEQRFREPGELVGQTLGFGLDAGTVVQSGMLAASPSLAEGRSLVPVLVRDNSLRSLLPPGTPVTLVLADSGQVVTADARISAMPGKSDGTVLNPGGSAKPLVLVDVPTGMGPEVSALGQQGKLTVVLGNDA